MSNSSLNRSLPGRCSPAPRSRLAALLLVAAASLAAVGCGRPFDVATPDGFVELNDQAPAYDYRATSPDGVVVAARAVDVGGRGDLAFWQHALTLELRDRSGYALLEQRAVRSADGTAGSRLVFGHDRGGQPYLYSVTLFLAQSRLFLLEAGGPKSAVAQLEPQIGAQAEAFRARCGFFLAPVLASRTCNRW